MKLTDILSRPVRMTDPPALPEPRRLTRLCEEIEERYGDASRVNPEDEARIIAELRRRLDEDDWNGAKLALVTAAARAAFAPKRSDRKGLGDLRTFLRQELSASTRPGFLATMASVYLDTWKPGGAQTRLLAEPLAARVADLPARWRRPFQALPELLDPAEGHRRLAARMAASDDPYGELVAKGMPDPHGPGLADNAHVAFVERLRPALAAADEGGLSAMLAWLAPAEGSVRNKGAAVAIAALLEPWRGQNPPEPFRRKLQDGLVEIYGDPRVRRGGVWASIPDDLKAIVLRWLTGATLKAFLDIVSHVESSHMWAPRRNFWWRLYEEGRIAEAWVALSESGADHARRIGLKSFARQTARRGSNQPSLLILKSTTGDKVLVEGSHNYKVHIFPRGHPEKPALYSTGSYDCERIRLSLDEANKHWHDPGGRWQSWVLERI